MSSIKYAGPCPAIWVAKTQDIGQEASRSYAATVEHAVSKRGLLYNHTQNA